MSWLFWRRTIINFYHPEADAVSLVMEGYPRPWEMRRDQRGYWSVRLDPTAQQLDGRAYHFEVRLDGHCQRIADPLAHRTERQEGELISYYSALDYRFKNSQFRAPPFDEIVIYEAHLPALSRHPSAQVEQEAHRGTYIGARSHAILGHLQRMKVAVEFLPLHAHSRQLGRDWGYYSTSYSAFRDDFALEPKAVNREVMELVDALHGREIPVLLDVVFNHGGELWVKAWGEDLVYRRLPEGGFCQGSGCGATIRTEHPVIRETILETLEHLVEKYRFDGFRFDLGALHDPETLLEIDRRLPERIYLIAEPWALGGTQWGKADMSQAFAGTRWAIWNDDFREPGRRFINGHGDQHNRDLLMRAIVGSHVQDGGWAVRPQQSVNYLSCHDGQTLADLVFGNEQRVFLGLFLVLTSQGIPMLGEGSEMLYSKQGHHNSYDRPDLNQLDWEQADRHSGLMRAVVRLIRLRKQLSHFHHHGHLKANDQRSDDWDVDWIYPTGFPHQDNVNAIAYLLRPPHWDSLWRSRKEPLMILLNGSHSEAEFRLPPGPWKQLVDGVSLRVNAFGLERPTLSNSHRLPPGTCALLAPA